MRNRAKCPVIRDALASHKEELLDGAIEDNEDVLTIDPVKPRLSRGGSFVSPESIVRSAVRYMPPPTGRGDNGGFRPARTLAP